MVNIGAVATEVDKVEMYHVSGLKPTGKEVMEDCIQIGSEQLQSGDPNETQANDSRIILNSGCRDSFTHTKMGTQWWYQNILIKEESTVQVIRIGDDTEEDASEVEEVDDGVCEARLPQI